VSPVKYEVGFYIPEYDILHSTYRNANSINVTDSSIEVILGLSLRSMDQKSIVDVNAYCMGKEGKALISNKLFI
jgi:hypothetical protein